MNSEEKYITGRDFWEATVITTPAAHKLHSAISITSPYESHAVDITLLVLCHNNEDDVIATLNAVVEALDVVDKTFEIIVIDDLSTDRTVEMVRGYIHEFPQLKIMLRINKKRKGVAANYVDGAFIGCGKYYRLVHGDNSESVETMVDVLGSLGDADIIVPYYISMRKKGLWERFTTRGFTWCVNRITGNQINYYDALPVHLRYNVMRWRPVTAGSAFHADLLCQLLDFGFTCKQVPCRAVPERTPGGFWSGVKNVLSAKHVVIELVIRRVSNMIHGGGE